LYFLSFSFFFGDSKENEPKQLWLSLQFLWPASISYLSITFITMRMLNTTSMMVSLSSIAAAMMMMTLVTTTSAFDYELASVGAISLTDSATSISDVVTLFLDQPVIVTVSELEWVSIVKDYAFTDDGNMLYFETSVDGIVQQSGNISLTEVGRTLPSSIEVGEVVITESGRHEISVTVTVVDSQQKGTPVSTSAEFESFNKALAMFPLAIILLLAVTTNMVRFRSFWWLLVCFWFGFAGLEEHDRCVLLSLPPKHTKLISLSNSLSLSFLQRCFVRV
jgi:hypothetical protein